MTHWDDTQLALTGPGGKVYLAGEEQTEYCWQYANRMARRLPSF